MDVSDNNPIPVLDGFRFGLVSVWDIPHTSWPLGILLVASQSARPMRPVGATLSLVRGVQSKIMALS